jgi:hypothetical protein
VEKGGQRGTRGIAQHFVCALSPLRIDLNRF